MDLPKTLLTQDCASYEDEAGVVHFRIENGIANVLDGDLPYPEIFLHQVNVANDPKADTFLRIATLSDLSGETRGRDVALSMGKNTYLDSRFVIEFDDLPTAVQGKQVIQARIDDLVSQWRMNEEQFVNPSSFTLPLADTSIVAAAKAALKKALADRDTKEATLEGLQAALKTAQSASSAASDAVTSAQARSDLCSQLNATLGQIYAGENTFRQAVLSFLSDCAIFDQAAQAHQASFSDDTSFPGRIADFEAALGRIGTAVAGEATGAKGLFDQLVATFATQCGRFTSELATARLQKQVADAAVAAAQTKVTLAEADATAAQAVADAALVTVSNYCPLFDPATDL